MKSYRKYTWAGNKIDDEDMRNLHELKKKTKTSITEMVAEAVKDYLIRKNKRVRKDSKYSITKK